MATVATLVATLSNHLFAIFKFPWVALTLRIFLQIVRSSSEKEYFLLTIMPTNCSQLIELESLQLVNWKRISLSVPDSVPCVVLFVKFRTEPILITIWESNSFRSILSVHVIWQQHGKAPKASKQFKVRHYMFYTWMKVHNQAGIMLIRKT